MKTIMGIALFLFSFLLFNYIYNTPSKEVVIDKKESIVLVKNNKDITIKKEKKIIKSKVKKELTDQEIIDNLTKKQKQEAYFHLILADINHLDLQYPLILDETNDNVESILTYLYDHKKYAKSILDIYFAINSVNNLNEMDDFFKFLYSKDIMEYVSITTSARSFSDEDTYLNMINDISNNSFYPQKYEISYLVGENQKEDL